jgi:hypothetical protein
VSKTTICRECGGRHNMYAPCTSSVTQRRADAFRLIKSRGVTVKKER